jgi:hypothetical protein
MSSSEYKVDMWLLCSCSAASAAAPKQLALHEAVTMQHWAASRQDQIPYPAAAKASLTQQRHSAEHGQPPIAVLSVVVFCSCSLRPNAWPCTKLSQHPIGAAQPRCAFATHCCVCSFCGFELQLQSSQQRLALCKARCYACSSSF